MSQKAKESLGWWTDLMFKAAVIAGPVAMLWLRSQFATKEDLESEREARRQVQQAVLLLTETKKHDTEQDARLGDHETRIRFLEGRVAGYVPLEGRGAK